MKIFEENFQIQSVSQLDCVNVKYIVKMICRRSAFLLSAAIATLINKMAISPVTIAIDGGMYRHHPTYKDMLKERIKCMINPKIEVSTFARLTPLLRAVMGVALWKCEEQLIILLDAPFCACVCMCVCPHARAYTTCRERMLCMFCTCQEWTSDQEWTQSMSAVGFGSKFGLVIPENPENYTKIMGLARVCSRH